MFEQIGLNTSAAVVSVMLIAVSIVPTVLLQIRGHVSETELAIARN